MHSVLARQLKRHGIGPSAAPTDPQPWSALLESIDHAYQQADQDRYLLERSLALSSEEMGELHRQLAAERDLITRVTCSLAEGVCAVDNDGRVLFINPEARRLLHLDPGGAITGERLAHLVSARSADGRELTELLADPAQDGDAAEEPRLVIGDGDSGFVTFTLSPLGQQREGVVLTLHDVTERKRMEAERKELNRRLVEVSRQAGMAEVASEVLHNVGNVLNSVNVSASIASEMTQASRRGGVVKLAELLEANRSRLADFLTSDPVGARAPEYLAEIGAELIREQERVCEELAKLRKSVDHIREIVATQQSCARVRGEREVEEMAVIVDEALRVLEPSFARHGVSVERDFQAAPPVRVERHQALQAMVNLINNARQAVGHLPPAERRVKVRIAPAGACVRTEIIDGGCGIPPENLTRIFVHGFTTRPDGHGFGLHSAAIAAKTMGGALAGASDGVGRGATFTLDIPAAHAESRRAA
jgi:PAS domain S-box-containing protein